MKRGDLVTVALQGDYGKPRPALIIQSDFFADAPSLMVLPVTSELRDVPLFRIAIDPSPANGLRMRSEIMIDKAQTISRDKIGAVIGHLESRAMVETNRLLALFLGLA